MFFKVGDRVKIIGNIPYHLRKRSVVIGRIISIDGGYIYVRPNWCKWEVELYESEIRLLG